jgi:D-sedoheptulose 7-phosphate isomerase
MSHTEQYLQESSEIIRRLDPIAIERVAELLARIKLAGGRLFFLGVGGNAANCSHAVNDFRKIAGIECYAPTDNVAELTARTNDDGWESVFAEWLKISKLAERDGLFIMSVGGGDQERNISSNLVRAIQFAKTVGAKVIGIVGRDGGFTGRAADACVIIPPINAQTITPHTESFQALIWHLLVSHPLLRENPGKWESVTA